MAWTDYINAGQPQYQYNPRRATTSSKEVRPTEGSGGPDNVPADPVKPNLSANNPVTPKAPWMQGIDYGMDAGKDLFYNDPDMQSLRATRQDLAKGYNGSELGAMREGSRRDVSGQNAGYMNQLRSNLARGGVGGARAAAIQNTSNQKYSQVTADNERKMALDSAQLSRQGANDLQDFLFRQKFGQLSTGLGYGQLASAGSTAAQALGQPAVPVVDPNAVPGAGATPVAGTAAPAVPVPSLPANYNPYYQDPSGNNHYTWS